MENIKIIIFDLDNTLVDFDSSEKDALKQAFDLMKVPFNLEVWKDFSKIDRDLWTNGTYNSIEISNDKIPLKRFEFLFEKHNINHVDIIKINDLFMEAFSKTIFPYEEAESILKYLKNKGYIITVATNGLKKLQYPRILNSNLGQYITQIVASEEVGFSKPNPLIFNKLLQDNKFTSKEAVIIGDSLLNDIQGAKNAHIKSIWLNAKDKEIANEKIIPDYTISNLMELTNIL